MPRNASVDSKLRPQVGSPSEISDTDLAQFGLRVLKKPGPKTNQPPAKCENFQARHGRQQGTVLGICAPAKPMVRLYAGQWSLDPSGNTWSAILTFPNSRAFVWTGLERGKDTWFRVRARNIAGPGPWRGGRRRGEAARSS